MIEVEQMLKDKNISEESGGAWIVHMQKLGVKSRTAIIRDPLELARIFFATLLQCWRGQGSTRSIR